MPNMTLRQKVPDEQAYTIAGPTHIGRATKDHWHVLGREIPKEFQYLDASLRIIDEYASRNHAGIIPAGNGFDIVDLNSENGTYVNEHRIARRRLAEGDVIKIGDLELHVEDLDAPATHYALFVGHDGGNLRGVKNDIREVAAKLHKRDFSTTQLFNEQATKALVTYELTQAAHMLSGDSSFLFYYSGHGNEQGLSLERGDISPKELYESLWNIRGKKAVILDNCLSGVFLSDAAKSYIPPNTLVVTAAGDRRLAFETDKQGMKMGRLSAALLQFLEDHPERIDLREFRRYITENIPFELINLVFQEPKVEGSSFTIMTARSQAMPLDSLILEGHGSGE